MGKYFSIFPTLQTYEERLRVTVPEEYSKDPKNNSFIRMILARMARNMDTRILIEGEGGIGKSWLSLRIAEILDEAFSKNPAKAVDKQVYFQATEFLRGVTTLPPLSVLLYDEPAQSWHHREFMSEVNIILSKMMIGFRYKRFISMLNIPNLDFIDKDARSLCQFLINVPKRGKAEIYQINMRKFGGGIWYKSLPNTYNIGQPSVKLRNAYEKKKRIFEDDLFEDYFRAAAQKDKPKLSNEDIAGMIKADMGKYMKKGKLFAPLIQGIHDIGRHRADSLKAKIELDEEITE